MAAVQAMKISAGNGLVRQEEPLRYECPDVPRWALRLIYRLAQMQQGQAYTVTVIMAGNEPVWMMQPLGKVENGR